MKREGHELKIIKKRKILAKKFGLPSHNYRKQSPLGTQIGNHYKRQKRELTLQELKVAQEFSQRGLKRIKEFESKFLEQL